MTLLPMASVCVGVEACFTTRARQRVHPARKMLGWPKRCKLAHAILREYCYERPKLAQLLGQLGVFLTHRGARAARPGATWGSGRTVASGIAAPNM